MRQNKNKPNPKFDSVAPGERKKGKSVKAKDYFLNRKGVSENTIKEIKKEKSARRAPKTADTKDINKKIAEDRYLVAPVRFDENFKGVANVGACELIIDGAIPGEREEVEIKRKKGTVFYADFVKTDEPAACRREVKCKNFLSCGNCAFLHISYDKQLEIKREAVKNAVEPFFAGVGETVSLGEFAYRNKAHLAFAEEGRNGEWFKESLAIILEWARSRSLHAYNPRTGKGFLRFALLRKLGDGLMLTLVVNGGKISGTESLYNSLKEKFGKVCLYACDNKTPSAAVLSGKLRKLHGEDYLEGEMLGVKFTLSPDSFFQVNEKTAERIYSDVLEIIKKSPAENGIDCFSGIGITSALFALSGKKVTSIEISPSAVRDAKRIGALNDLSADISYIRGDAAKILTKIGNAEKSIFFVDPPRSGLGEKTALMITGYAPREIVYLSCNPQTLKEDIKTIIENGYKIVSATPYDLFPETKHVETLVLFSAKQAK